MRTFIVTLVLLAGNAAAAEPETAESETPPEPTTETTGMPTNPDIFVPTEEISEDFAVPFPVDI